MLRCSAWQGHSRDRQTGRQSRRFQRRKVPIDQEGDSIMTEHYHRGSLWLAGTAMLAITAATPALAQQQAANAADSGDIIVTATKRNESVRQIAAPISAVSGDQLQKMNANSLGDYIARLPGVVFNDYQPGVSEVVIRGIAATTYHEQGQTTVGYYINEFDVQEPNFPIVIPDVDTFDLDRVEVLRGPQGTLFGSSALGGVVNYVVKTADASKFDLAGEGLIGSTKNAAGQLNYAGKVMVNIPIISDKLAVRVMALQRFDAGYIDNIGLTPPRKATNDFRTRGIRGSVVFTPFDGTKITYMGMYQDSKLDDQTYISFDHTYTRTTGLAEPQKTSFFLNTLRLDQEIGDFANLSVLGSVDKKTNFTRFTDPYYFGVFSGPNVAFDDTHAHANIKTIEARLASKGDGPFRWLIGTSYIRSTKYSFDQMWAPGSEAYLTAHPDPTLPYPASALAPNDRIYAYLTNTLNTDFGIFGEATWKPVKGLEITAGGRYYSTRAEGDVNNMASYLAASPVDLTGHVNQKEHGFTPKASITVRPNSHLLAYLTYSRGYRVGGINPNAGLLPSIQSSYKSDKVDNYEAGLKATLWNGRLIADVSVFDMVWKNIQAREFGPAPQFFSFVENASSANVAGVEIAASVRPTRQLSLSTSITYEDARLTSVLPYAFAPDGVGYPSGTRLPGSSKWSISNNIDYEFTDVPGKPTVQLAHRYLSSAPVAFQTDVMRGNFNLFDARVSVTLREHFRLTGFIDNFTNKYGILNGPFSAQTAPAYSIVRPRTFGLRVDWSL
jgi:outer membrane receptor protein involved in Fe transport